MAAVIDESVDKMLDAGSSNPEKEQDKLERDLERIDNQLTKLQEGREDSQAMDRVVQNLAEVYAGLNDDWRRIKLQATSDYRTSPELTSNKLGVTSEAEIKEACRFVLQLTELQKKKAEIEGQLGVLLGVQVKPLTSAFKPRAKDETEAKVRLPTFRVMLDFDNKHTEFSYCCWVAQVQSRPGNLKPFTFPGGTRGLVYEVRRSDYPRPRTIEERFKNGYSCLMPFDPSKIEPLTVTAMIHLDEPGAKALKQTLKDSHPDGDPPYIWWRDFATPEQLQGFDESEKRLHPDPLDEPPETEPSELEQSDESEDTN
jgi:hypothetical protein